MLDDDKQDIASAQILHVVKELKSLIAKLPEEQARDVGSCVSRLETIADSVKTGYAPK